MDRFMVMKFETRILNKFPDMNFKIISFFFNEFGYFIQTRSYFILVISQNPFMILKDANCDDHKK